MDMDYQIEQWMIVMILIFGNGTISKSLHFITYVSKVIHSPGDIITKDDLVQDFPKHVVSSIKINWPGWMLY